MQLRGEAHKVHLESSTWVPLADALNLLGSVQYVHVQISITYACRPVYKNIKAHNIHVLALNKL